MPSVVFYFDYKNRQNTVKTTSVVVRLRFDTPYQCRKYENSRLSQTRKRRSAFMDFYTLGRQTIVDGT